MGFIGRNGAGKTTTLKSILGLVHPDGGSVEICGKDFAANELWCKNQIGFMCGGISYYRQKRLKTIASVTSRFYPGWNDGVYREYLRKFDLDENKKISELSEGMKVKFALAMALSHQARLLILDEPTSGLDPVSREEITDIFQQIIEDGTRSILFSTQITADLQKCADYITYIKQGRIVASEEKDVLLDNYRLVSGGAGALSEALKEKLIGCKTNMFGFTALIHREDLALAGSCEIQKATIDDIMVYFERN